mmetsp:Transcript_46146/g.118905  ORF Transcript_46146/g.118905 Transcript_46146/m.118905 type:complete len:90 (-) Transcript_46146:920-1189(-)|eukprot:CAMPEP_0113882798 /NCGR_PEP_ID=MMETSP0780_2-20120614/9189_1 /TAXON_ID=652834 /ORGANISM="Palpitomonas bilix" /LENGTH=89 /DNA_ID=CAMNT_0000869921 /DNA_START=704 /DNA_END=973 /DNA_ORIENTATION=+ /assembly_acc=CAM_ASM_000599
MGEAPKGRFIPAQIAMYGFMFAVIPGIAFAMTRFYKWRGSHELTMEELKEDSKAKAERAAQIKNESVAMLFDKSRQEAWWKERNYEEKK